MFSIAAGPGAPSCGAARRLCAGFAMVAALGACDTREQKPKVEPLAGLSPIGIASAQQADQVVPPAATSSRLAPVDEAFALFAASGGMAEIEGARLVQKSTQRNEVLEYAQKLARDHTKAIDDLRRIVAPRGLKLPVTPTGRHADMVTKLSGVAAADRDEAFLQRFGVDAHKETIALFERHAVEGQDPELRRHAREMLPMLREHAGAAQKLIHAAGLAR